MSKIFDRKIVEKFSFLEKHIPGTEERAVAVTLYVTTLVRFLAFFGVPLQFGHTKKTWGKKLKKFKKKKKIAAFVEKVLIPQTLRNTKSLVCGLEALSDVSPIRTV